MTIGGPHPQRRRILLFIGLFVAIALDTTVQVFWKASVPVDGRPLAILTGTLVKPLFIASMFLHVWQLFNWMMVLALAELSFAQPITALSYVTVTACAALFFHERIGPREFIGILLVLAGVALVSRTARPAQTLTVGAPSEKGTGRIPGAPGQTNAGDSL